MGLETEINYTVKQLAEVLKTLEKRLDELEREVSGLEKLLVGVCPKCQRPIKIDEVTTKEGKFKAILCKCGYMLLIRVNEEKRE